MTMSLSHKNTLYLNGLIYAGYGLVPLFAPQLFTSIYFKSHLPMNDEVHNAWQFYGQQNLVIAALNFAVARNGTKTTQKAASSCVAMGCMLGFCLCIKNKEKSDALVWYQAVATMVSMAAINAYFAFSGNDEK